MPESRDLYGGLSLIHEDEYGSNQISSLQDYYNSNAEQMGPGDIILGNVILEIPPTSIQVNDVYNIMDLGGAIRQRGSMKMNKGRTSRSIIMSFYFVDSGGPMDVENISRVVNLFKFSPFCSVYNEYLNITWGVDAVALVDMTIMSDEEVPGGYFVIIKAEQFNYKAYVPYAPTLASITDYQKYTTYLNRGIILTEKEMSSGGKGITSDFIHSDTDIDFMIHDIIPPYIPGGFRGWEQLYNDATYADYTMNELRERYGTDAIDEIQFGFNFGGAGITHWNPAQLAEFLVRITNTIGQANMTRIRNQVERQGGGELSTEEIDFITARIFVQQLQLIIDNAGEQSGFGDNQGDINHENAPGDETWIEEWAVPMIGVKLTDEVSIAGISITIHNEFARLPILSQPKPVHQYLGGGSLMLDINMEVLGEREIQKINWLFSRSQDVARLTRAIGTLGFLGVRSDITKIAGCKYYMPYKFTARTVPDLPHVYAVNVVLTDFDIFQQEKENWTKGQAGVPLVGNPFMRLKQFGKYINLYPDMPLEFDNGWETPDFYYMTTPVISSSMQANGLSTNSQYIAQVGNNPAGFEYGFGWSPDQGFTVTYGDATYDYNYSIDQSAADRDASKNPEDVDASDALVDSFSDLQRHDLTGTMARAFPTYMLFLIDEPRNLIIWRTFGDFYGRRSVVGIQSHTNQYPMYDVCQITMTDQYHKSSTAPHEYTDMDLGQIVAAADRFWDRVLQITGMGPDELEHIDIQEGMRIQLRMGYGNDVDKLGIAFNGTITEVIPDSGVLSIIAQGDGRELLGILNPGDEKGDTADISGLFYSEPRDLLIKLLTMRTSIARDALALAMGGRVHPSPRGGIRHFGMLLPNTNDDISEGDDLLIGIGTKGGPGALIDEVIDGLLPSGMSNMSLLGDQVFFPQIQGILGSMLPGGDPSGSASGSQSDNTPKTIDEVENELYAPENNYEFHALSSSMTQFKDILKESLKKIWLGWDTEIFKRNIYPGNGIGVAEKGSQQTDTPAGDVKQHVWDTLDFMTAEDEPSFKIYTWQRTIWDIMRSATDIIPNYILAVRPFEYRSTLFYGKAFWSYTSGVNPINEYSPEGISSINIGPIMDEYKDTLQEVTKSLISPSGIEAEINKAVQDTAPPTRGYDPLDVPGGVGGVGERVDGAWLDSNILKGTGLAGYGQAIANAAVAYGVPWDLALAMFRKEASFMTAGKSVQANNPGNLMLPGAAKWGNVVGSLSTTNHRANGLKGGLAVYSSVTEGINAYFKLLGTNYRSYIDNNDWRGLIYKYAPPSENDSGQYVSQITSWAAGYRSAAQKAGAILSSASSSPSSAPSSSDPSSYSGGIGSERVAGATYTAPAGSEARKELDKLDSGSVIDSAFKNIFNEGNGNLDSNWDNWLTQDIAKPGEMGGPGFSTYGKAIEELSDSSQDDLKNQEKSWISSLWSVFEQACQDDTFFNEGVLPSLARNGGITSKEAWADAFSYFVFLNGKKDPIDIVPSQTKFTVGGVSYDISTADGLTTALANPDARKWIEDNLDFTLSAKMPTVEETIKDQGIIDGLKGLTTDAADKLIDSAMGAIEGIRDAIQRIIEFVKSLGRVGEAFINLFFNLVPQSFRLLSVQMKMQKLQKEMDKKYLDSTYYTASGGAADNPFTREFQEEVSEIREPFARIHYSTSFTDMINWNVSADSRNVYPVIHAVSSGKKAQTVYADKSISSEYQKERTVETYLNWDILNLNEKIYAKRIGLAECARSLKTMYNGNFSMVGNSRIRPYDYIYVANAYDDYWGLCEVHSVTHTMRADMGWITSLEINPIVIVDDPGTWAWTTAAHRLVANLVLPSVVAGATTANSPVSQALEALVPIKTGIIYDFAVGAAGAAYNVAVGTATYPGNAAVDAGVVVGGAVVNPAGSMGIGPIPGLSDVFEWVDGRQDVWIGLLCHWGRPYHAGLKGSNGIIIGEAQSTGFDIIDFFLTNKPNVTWNDIAPEIGMSPEELDTFLDRRNEILGRIFSEMLSDTGRGPWATPRNGWTIFEGVSVNYVVDGDTIDVTMPDGTTQRIRLAGINAPEMGTLRGQRAKEFVESFLNGATVVLKFHPDYAVDEYGRGIAWVYVNGMNMSIALYRAGLANIANTDQLNAPDDDWLVQ